MKKGRTENRKLVYRKVTMKVEWDFDEIECRYIDIYEHFRFDRIAFNSYVSQSNTRSTSFQPQYNHCRRRHTQSQTTLNKVKLVDDQMMAKVKSV